MPIKTRQQTRRAVALALAWGVLALLMFSAAASAAPRVTLHKMAAKAGKYDFYFSYLDDQKKPISDVTNEQVKLLSLDTKKEFSLGSPKLQLIKDSDRTVAVLFVVANYRAFNDKNTGAMVTVSDFVGKMRSTDTAGILHYGENQTNISFTPDLKALSSKVERIKDGNEAIPKIFDAVSGGLRRFDKELSSQVPSRKYMVIITDGHGPWEGASDTDKEVGRKIDRLAARLKSENVTPLIIGFAPNSGPDEPSLDRMREFAEQSNGSYRVASDKTDLETLVKDAREEIYQSYVLNFDTSDFEPGKSYKLQLQAKKTKSSSSTFDVPTNAEEGGGMSWLAWIGIAIACLFGLLILVALIMFVLNRGRDEDEQYVDPNYGGYDPGYQPEPVQAYDPAYAPPAPTGMPANNPNVPPPNQRPPARYFARLRGQNGDYEEVNLYLTDETTTLGSAEGNTLVLKDSTISKKHAGIRVKDGSRFELRDFGSTNGVFVNGTRTARQFLREGDRIRFGRLEFLFNLPD